MKGDRTSKATESAKRVVTTDYCDRYAGENKAIGNIVGKHMYKLLDGKT